jgi:hypothetical protein
MAGQSLIPKELLRSLAVHFDPQRVIVFGSVAPAALRAGASERSE